MDAQISPVQQQHLDLLRSAWGQQAEAIITDLLACRSVWSAVMGGTLVGVGGGELIPLRDLSDGMWNIDTLYVLVKGDSDHRAWAQDVLKLLAERWSSEFTWLDTAGPPHQQERLAKLLGTGEPHLALARFWWD
jgi:hypothetical protein